MPRSTAKVVPLRQRQKMGKLLPRRRTNAELRSREYLTEPTVREDEHYVIQLCDDVLGLRAHRQHRFDFLLGDPSPKTGRRVRLPVDAFYPERNLVVEYHERQHVEPIGFFNGRQTMSGSRGVQRAIYDQRSREILPKHGLRYIEIRYLDFSCDSRRRIIKSAGDVEIVRRILSRSLGNIGAS